jgi:hypothetical protein
VTTPFEPSAETRVAARQIRNLYEALILEGFQERQALTILGQVLAASANGGTDK